MILHDDLCFFGRWEDDVHRSLAIFIMGLRDVDIDTSISIPGHSRALGKETQYGQLANVSIVPVSLIEAIRAGNSRVPSGPVRRTG